MIVLISGKMGSGKTTLVNQFQAAYPVFKFADPLYEMHHALWDAMDRYGVLTREEKSGDLLQVIGDIMRKRDPLVFVKCAITKARCLEEKNQYVLNDDTRFLNELKAFPNALKIRLECDRDKRKARAESWRENENHKSEIDLDGLAAEGMFDLYIDTDITSVPETHRMLLAKMNGQLKDRGHFEIPEFREKFYLNKNM